jgi:hypothetical protein
VQRRFRCLGDLEPKAPIKVDRPIPFQNAQLDGHARAIGLPKEFAD